MRGAKEKWLYHDQKWVNETRLKHILLTTAPGVEQGTMTKTHPLHDAAQLALPITA